MFAPALAKSPTMRSTGLTIRCTSIRQRDVRPQRFAYQRADGQIGDVMVVHHVEVNQVGAGARDRPDLFAEAREIGRQQASVQCGTPYRVRVYNAPVPDQKRYEISVDGVARYLPEQSDEQAGRYVFAYTIHACANTGNGCRRSW